MLQVDVVLIMENKAHLINKVQVKGAVQLGLGHSVQAFA